MSSRSVLSAVLCTSLALSLVACQTDTATTPIGVAPGGPFLVTATQSLSLSPANDATVVTLPSASGFGGTGSFPAVLAAVTTTLTETIQNTAPTDGTPALSQSRIIATRSRHDTSAAHTTLLYFNLVSSAAASLSNSPTFALNVPASDVVAGASYEIASYNATTQTWDAAWEGPATIAGTTLTFGTNNLGTFTFAPGATNWFALLEYAASFATPGATATPTPVASPVATATPTPVAAATPTAVATVTPTPAPTATLTPVATATPTAVATVTPTPVATATRTPIATASPTPIATAVPTPTASPTPRATATPTATPTATAPTCAMMKSGGPAVCSISPTRGAVGSTVVINGNNFIPPLSIIFNGNASAAGSFTSTKITVTVPSGALTGSITVQTSKGSAQSGVFTVTSGTPTPTPT